MYELEQKSQNAGNRTYEVLDFKISPGEDSYLRIPLEMWCSAYDLNPPLLLIIWLKKRRAKVAISNVVPK
jgi:hypothetical protein